MTPLGDKVMGDKGVNCTWSLSPQNTLTCDDDGLPGHWNVASTSGSFEERLFEDENYQDHGEQQQQLKHLPIPRENNRLTEL